MRLIELFEAIIQSMWKAYLGGYSYWLKSSIANSQDMDTLPGIGTPGSRKSWACNQRSVACELGGWGCKSWLSSFLGDVELSPLGLG